MFLLLNIAKKKEENMEIGKKNYSKILAWLIAIVMVFTMAAPTTSVFAKEGDVISVSSFDEFVTAMGTTQGGIVNIKLTNDINYPKDKGSLIVRGDMNFAKKIIIDLDTHDLNINKPDSGAMSCLFAADNVDLTIKSSATGNKGGIVTDSNQALYVFGGTMNLEGITVTSTLDNLDTSSVLIHGYFDNTRESVFNMDQESVITTSDNVKSCGIIIHPGNLSEGKYPRQDNVEVNIAGTIDCGDKTNDANYVLALTVNGNFKDKTAEVNIAETAKLYGPIYAAGKTDLTVDGYVKAGTAVEIKNGSLTVGDTAELISTDTYKNENRGGGMNTWGAAIAASTSPTYGGIGTPDVTVKDGAKVTAASDGKAFSQTNFTSGECGTIDVQGGTFVGDIVADTATKFIKSGTFDKKLEDDYISEDSFLKESNGKYVIVEVTEAVDKIENILAKDEISYEDLKDAYETYMTMTETQQNQVPGSVTMKLGLKVSALTNRNIGKAEAAIKNIPDYEKINATDENKIKAARAEYDNAIKNDINNIAKDALAEALITLEKAEKRVSATKEFDSIIIGTKSYVYDGKEKTQTITTTIDKANYKVQYKNNVKTGKATVEVTGTNGSYVGLTKTSTFNIVPAKAAIKKVTKGKKSFKVTINSQSKSGVTGYEVAYSTKKSSGFKKINTSSVKKTIKKLKSKKKYYVKVRAYKTIDGKKVYGKYSGVKSIKTK